MINFLFDDAMNGMEHVKAINNVIVAEAENKDEEIVEKYKQDFMSDDEDIYDGENAWPERFETLGDDDDDDDDDDWDMDDNFNESQEDWDDDDDDDDE